VTDPDCSESPYQEPDADVRGEVIAGFVVAGAVLLVGALYVVHLRVIKKQSERIREALVKRIAADINVGFSDQALTVEGLQEEFNKIDTSNDGLVSILLFFFSFLCNGQFSNLRLIILYIGSKGRTSRVHYVGKSWNNKRE